MSYEFFSRKELSGRKDHTCEHCRKLIHQGESHFYCAGKFDGCFVSYREHTDCEKAWLALNEELRDRGRECDDGYAFLADDDYDDGEREWLHERFPAVTARIWPDKFGSASTPATADMEA